MFRRPCLAAALLLVLIPEAAEAATALDTRVSAAGASAVPCQSALRPGAPGVVTKPVLVSGPAHVEVRLNGTAGDWDVALFDATGKAIAAAGSPDAQEVAAGWAVARSTLTLQACRLSGPSSVPVTVTQDLITPSEVAEARADAPQLVSVSTPTRADKDRLVALGLDMTEHGGTDALGVVLHGAEDRAALAKAGLTYKVLVKDLVAKDARDAAAAPAAADFPSGPRTTYRTLADYETELKALAAANPTLVRLITLPNKTLVGRDVLGIEITENVTANDGKPAFVNMGVHHAREWPAGELTMEWAYELITKYKAGDPRATNIVRNSRNIVVPIVNPDGFNGSRTESGGPAGGQDESVDDTAYIAARPGEYRRKNCRVGDTQTAACPVSVGLAENGVDPNRNYGQFWGGPGSDTNPATQTYRGAAPFSEPESRNIQWLVSRNQVMSLITNHTTAGLVLRAPGLAAVGPPVDENAGYKDLGDAMAKENGYFSQKGYELYDTTGTTEDWSYNATGGYGFTFELYCGAPNYTTGDCDKPSFHPLYNTMAKEWDGTSAQADHVNDPAGPYDGKGNREAYYLAAESAINQARHSLLEGSAPAGTRLRLTKDFKTAAFDPTVTVDDHLETIYDVGVTGAVRWHVNPSTRPLVAKDSGKLNGGAPAAPETRNGGIQGATDDPNNDGAAFGGDADTGQSLNYNDHPFTIPATGDNAAVDIRAQWASIASDWDLKVYLDKNGNGKSDPTDEVVSTSAQGTTDFELVTLPNPVAGTKYVARVVNFAALEPYELTIKYQGPPPYKAAQTETYTLTCETATGTVLKSQQVFVARGQTARFDACPALPPATKPSAGGGGTSPSACAATAGFSSVGFSRSGKGGKFSLTPRSAGGKATVSIFQQSSGRRITGERLVARFKNKTGAFTWNGKGAKDGYYFVRFTLGKDTRRITLRRSGGKFTRVGDHYRRASCDLLPSYKLSRPVFGGTANKPLGISYRVARKATVTVTVLRGSKVVKRFAARTVNSSGKATLPAKGLARGDYKVKLTAKAGSDTVTSTLLSRRL